MSRSAGQLRTIHEHQSHLGWNHANPPVLSIAPGDTVELT